MLIGRNYRPGVINSAIERAKMIPRFKALEKVPTKKNDRVILTLEYSPQLPSVSGIIKSAWRVMTQDPHMKKVFPEPPMLAWKRPKSLRDNLVKTKVPEQSRLSRSLHGMKKCNKSRCNTCPYVRVGKEIKSVNTDKVAVINTSCFCDTSGLVYYIKCLKQGCNQEYIGQTGRKLSVRFGEHLGYVRNKTDDPTGIHFNLPGHNLSHMEVSVLEKVYTNNRAYREQRESMWIRDFQTEVKGMNKKK